ASPVRSRNEPRQSAHRGGAFGGAGGRLLPRSTGQLVRSLSPRGDLELRFVSVCLRPNRAGTRWHRSALLIVSSDDLHEGGRKGRGLREQIPLLLVVLADQE